MLFRGCSLYHAQLDDIPLYETTGVREVFVKHFIDKLEKNYILDADEFTALLDAVDDDLSQYLFEKSRVYAKQYYGTGIYLRGLIELSSYCKNDCYYCGIRRSNKKAERYRLTEPEILSCCANGYGLGFRTFVLQGGEDGYFTDERLTSIIKSIKKEYPDCAITLSLGERSKQSYQRLYDAGADRYLLRHETATPAHYQHLHPENLRIEHRKECLFTLKQIGYQVGSGFMVGSPGQTTRHLAQDLLFLHELEPSMVGIGPFLPHHATPFAQEQKGSLAMTLFLIGVLRMMFPNILISATTALGTIDKKGREKGILAGANVVMPNLSPVAVRKKYALYDNKICTGDEAAECRLCLGRRLQSIGYEINAVRGDCKPVLPGSA